MAKKTKKSKIMNYLDKNPDAPVRQIMQDTKCVNSYASTVKAEWKKNKIELRKQQSLAESKLPKLKTTTTIKASDDFGVVNDPFEDYVKKAYQDVEKEPLDEKIEKIRQVLNKDHVSAIEDTICFMNDLHRRLIDGMTHGYNPINFEDTITLLETKRCLERCFKVKNRDE